MQKPPNNKLERNQRATLTGLSAMQITHARKALGRAFSGGEDHEFVRVAKQWKPEGQADNEKMFTKRL